jgi:hypothetical protein
MKKPKRTYSRKLIKDEFTALKVSRQRKWQLRRVKAGLCTKCSDPIVPGEELCIKHRILQALAHRQRWNSPHKYKGKWIKLAESANVRLKNGVSPWKDSALVGNIGALPLRLPWTAE